MLSSTFLSIFFRLSRLTQLSSAFIWTPDSRLLHKPKNRFSFHGESFSVAPVVSTKERNAPKISHISLTHLFVGKRSTPLHFAGHKAPKLWTATTHTSKIRSNTSMEVLLFWGLTGSSVLCSLKKLYIFASEHKRSESRSNWWSFAYWADVPIFGTRVCKTKSRKWLFSGTEYIIYIAMWVYRVKQT